MARRAGKARFHGVLLAGGSGTRFWPLSRSSRPKQFLPLAGREPLLVETWRRIRKLTEPESMWVVAPAALARPIRKMLPELGRHRLVLEPSPRDTGPAVGLACAAVARRDPRAIVGIFPTDHAIRDDRAFARSVRLAAKIAADDALVCLGIRPDRPATGFGYLKCTRTAGKLEAVPVERFVEKPDEATARRFLRSGKYLWNAGMFVWKAERFLREMARVAPRTLRAIEGHLSGTKGAWERAQKLSVDFAVMEKAEAIRVVPLDAGWDDVGSWDAAARLREEAGASSADEILVDSPGASVFAHGRPVAVVGVPGVVVVDSPDGLLVVSREGAEKVRKVVDRLRREGKLS